MDQWITDTEPSERFPLYTRGNADEVGPEPFSPLGLEPELGAGRVPRRRGRLGLARRLHAGRVPVAGARDVRQLGRLLLQPGVGRPGVRRPRPGREPGPDRRVVLRQESVGPAVRRPTRGTTRPSAAPRSARCSAGSSARRPQPDCVTDFIAQVDGLGEEPSRPRPRCSDADLIRYGREANLRLRPTWDVYTFCTIAAATGPGIVGGIAAGRRATGPRGRGVRRDRRRRQRATPRAGCGRCRASPRRRRPSRTHWTPARHRAGRPAGVGRPGRAAVRPRLRHAAGRSTGTAGRTSGRSCPTAGSWIRRCRSA